jgi:2-C-methyl-D-erythritol 4-phosphate cytidylyltransferase
LAKERVGAVIPAAGRSTRMRGEDKLFLCLCGKPLLAWCMDTLERCHLVTDVVVALNSDTIALGEGLCRTRGWTKARFCLGGDRRQDSVGNALRAIGAVDWVIVHDGDRPFLTQELLQEGLRFARETGVAVASVPVKDTVKVADESNNVLRTLEREVLHAVQTPQVFRADIIREAYAGMSGTVTDDAMLVERLGCTVRLYPGSYQNMKVTTPEDLLMARAIAERWGAAA